MLYLDDFLITFWDHNTSQRQRLLPWINISMANQAYFSPKWILTTQKETSCYIFLKWLFFQNSFVISWGTYSGVQIRWQRVFWAENQGNHQNFDTSLLTYKSWLIFMAMKKKQKFFFEKKNSKWPTQKKVIFHLRQFSIFFFEIFMDGSLG